MEFRRFAKPEDLSSCRFWKHLTHSSLFVRSERNKSKRRYLWGHVMAGHVGLLFTLSLKCVVPWTYPVLFQPTLGVALLPSLSPAAWCLHRTDLTFLGPRFGHGDTHLYSAISLHPSYHTSAEMLCWFPRTVVTNHH